MRFAEGRLAGLADAPRSGKPRTYGEDADRRILALLDQPPPAGFARWTAPLLAEALGDVSDQYVWRFCARSGSTSPGASPGACRATPSSPPRPLRSSASIAPPENAIVPRGRREKAGDQAWNAAPASSCQQPFAPGHARVQAARQRSTCSPRSMLPGQIKARHTGKPRRVSSSPSWNAVVADYSDQEIHVVLDNRQTHKPKRDRWLARHKNVHFHFTPTHASWLNQVEIWFSILARSALNGASFTSVRQLRQAIDAFIEAYNPTATPFQLQQTKIHHKGFAQRITDL
jgi:hypothetical protein